MIFRITLLVILLTSAINARATHVMGGDITWTCQGGQYVFQLVFYRDCNGAVINTGFETLDVWNHPTLSSIQVNYVSSTDVSPYCTQVPGGPVPLDCGSGQAGGNGLGAIEKAVYQSAPINLGGNPPPEGWIFTYQNFSRSSSITNLVNPDSYGITITAKMFPIPGAAGGSCVDNSPQFLQEPYFVSCAGEPYEYNMNAVDPDLDSLSISFGNALNYFPAQVWNPPTTPAEIPYEVGFSGSSPTPNPSMNAGNVSAALDPSSGNLTFTSFNTGDYVVKVVAKSYRNGVLIAEVMREMQLVVLNCSGNNNAPVITGPFGGLFETTVNAGTLVNFNLSSTDVEVLQDGSPQDNILTASGLMFGAGFTNPAAGCAVAPCAVLDATPAITMSQGVTTNFNWQTTCDHLITPYGTEAAMIPYHFVFKVQDNYCQVPEVSYATVTINVVNPGIVEAPEIECIQTNAAGDVTINWTQVNDPVGTFNEYQIYSVQNGLIGTVSNIGTTTFTVPAVTQQYDFYVATASGCNGNALMYSDTISNIFLTLNNPNNGTAQLQWNDPVSPALASMGSYYYIYREYPAGVWTLHDSVPYGTHFLIDTIDICSAFLNYQIVLPNSPCDYTSNIEGDNFQDMIAPDIPVLNSVTVDTITGAVTITWNENVQPDTYGYVIYVDIGGVVIELDQVFGITTTSYTYYPDITQGPLTYSVAAFDSCLIASNPAIYQTSAKANLHTSMFTTSTLNVCNNSVDLEWNSYGGWSAIDHYVVYGEIAGQGWSSYGSTTDTTFLIDAIPGETYTFVVQAYSTTGDSSFSSPTKIYIQTPGQPSFNYLQVATVSGDEVHLRHHIDNSVSIASVSIQRLEGTNFVELDKIPVTGTTLSYIDTDVDVQELSYIYRAQVIDSCGRPGAISNEAQTILLKIDNDDVQKLNYVYWNPYHEFNGSILGYDLYRGYDGIFNGPPIATMGPGTFEFTDDVNNVVSDGKICYRVEAVESINIYNFAERSRSNDACITLPPLIYIPNAFVPDGVNKVFVPVISDFDPTDYDFTIFNRWGQVVFKTNIPGEGWTGIIQSSGKMATNDTYTYMVTVHDGDGIEIIKRGHVSLLK